MYNNHEKELCKKNRYYEGWTISKKYTDILMLHSDGDKHIGICFVIHSQYMDELKKRCIPLHKNNNYVQCWDTLLNTLLRNPKVKVQRAAIKLLHQTSVQRSYGV